MKTDFKLTSSVHFLAELLIFFTGPPKQKMAKKHKGDISLARKGAPFRTGAKTGWDIGDFPDKTINLKKKRPTDIMYTTEPVTHLLRSAVLY